MIHLPVFTQANSLLTDDNAYVLKTDIPNIDQTEILNYFQTHICMVLQSS